MSGSETERRFLSLYEANAVALLGYAARRVELRDDAADVVAEVFMVAWRRIDEVPLGDQARLWLYGVARNVLSNHQRSASRRERLRGRIRHEHGLMRSSPWASDEVDEVRRALWGLSADDRELLLLTIWEGLSPTDLAIAMDIASGTVRSRLHRARRRLRRKLSPSEDQIVESERRDEPRHESEDLR